jgi:hypothetical protein
MAKLMKAFILALSLLLIQTLAGASEYEFGTKVLAQDEDIGRALYNLPFADIMYWDVGPNPSIYDEGDVLYLVFTTSPVVTANTVRITPFEYYAAGSKVRAGDKDIDMPLAAFLPGHAIVYLDLFGSSFFDIKDPVYFHNFGPNTITNDVRLTNVSNNAPGTKVIDFDPDHSKPTVTLQILPVISPSLIAYFDVNGNGVYDYPDDMYLIYPKGGGSLYPHVRVNSIRLSGPVY